MVSDEIAIDCFIPHKFHYTDTSLSEEHPVISESCFLFYYPVEVNEVEGSKLILYREGLPIMTFDVSGAWDFGFGFSTSAFGKFLNFEKGVNYSFVLPEGSVYSRVRNDIVNAASRYDFVGAYDKTFAPIEYTSCSVEGQKGLTVLGEVSIDYATPVQLAPDARLQLVDGNGDVVAESAVELAENGGVWRLTADFGGIGLAADGGYSLCLPEATVVGTGSDITVNQRTLVPINGNETSVETVHTARPQIALHRGQMTVGGLERGCRVSVYAPDGTLVGKVCAEKGEARLTLPSLPLYIIKVNGEAYKVSGVAY